MHPGCPSTVLSSRIVVALAGLLFACAPNKGGDSAAPSLGDVLPDWGLTDVNENSPSAGETVRVSDQRGRVSAWYFGHST